MSGLVIDTGVVSAMGSVIRDLSRMMDEPAWVSALGSGSVGADMALDAIDPVVGRQLLGAATEVFRIGQGAVDAAAHLLDADARLAGDG